VDTLQGLFTAGLIEAGESPGDLPATPLSRASIEAALAEPGPLGGRPCTYYRLTPEGGSRWEVFARPDWSRYVSQDLDHDSGRGSLTCVDRQWLEQYLELLSAVDPLVGQRAADYREVRPWQATYWKCLPQAHSASFPCGEAVSDVQMNKSLPVWVAEAGFYAQRDGWYRWR
jgi:hypothetical protein